MKKLYSLIIVFSLMICSMTAQINVELNRLNVIADGDGYFTMTDSTVVASISNGDTIRIQTAQYASNYFWFTIKNLETSNKTYNIRKSNVNFMNDAGTATLYICRPATNNTPGNCVDAQETGSFIMEPNELVYADVQYYNGKARKTVADITLYLGSDFDSASEEDKITFTLIFDTSNISSPMQNANEFSVFPNPASSNFTVNGDFSSASSVEVYDIIGKLVYKTKVEKGIESINIDCNKWEKGYYFVRLLNNQKINKTLKLIVK